MSNPRMINRTEEAYSSPLLIKSLLKEPLKHSPDKKIIYRDKFTMDYKTFNQRVAKLANVLTDIGVKAGDVVGVLDFDSHRYLELYFAVPMIGAVLHTINYRLPPQQVLYTINHAEDKVVICHNKLLPLLNGIYEAFETVQNYILMADGQDKASSDIAFEGEYEALVDKASTEYVFPDFDENGMATLFYTTGTTGKPKGVYFSHRQLVLHTQATALGLSLPDTVLTISEKDVYMPITPMFHVHAWGFPYIATMMGMKQVYPGKYEPEMLVKLIQSQRVTISHCVPTILSMLVNSPIAKKMDWSFWRVVIGGSALPTGLAKATLNLDINVIGGYGMSETCPVLTIAYLTQNDTANLSVEAQIAERCKTGRPIPFVELHIMDEDGNILPNDGQTMGEVVVRTPWLTQGYFKEEQQSRELWKYGYLHTGDIATVEPNGTVMIRDRKKDVIKTGGEWVSSLELESILSTHPAVKEDAVVAQPDKKWGERPMALVVLEDGKEASAEELNKRVQSYIDSGHLSKYALLDDIHIVSEIPKTSVGKIDKKKIRAEFGKI